MVTIQLWKTELIYIVNTNTKTDIHYIINIIQHLIKLSSFNWLFMIT